MRVPGEAGRDHRRREVGEDRCCRHTSAAECPAPGMKAAKVWRGVIVEALHDVEPRAEIQNPTNGQQQYERDPSNQDVMSPLGSSDRESKGLPPRKLPGQSGATVGGQSAETVARKMMSAYRHA